MEGYAARAPDLILWGDNSLFDVTFGEAIIVLDFSSSFTT